MEQHLGEQTYGDNAFSKYICCKISQQVLESGRNSAICIFFLGGGMALPAIFVWEVCSGSVVAAHPVARRNSSKETSDWNIKEWLVIPSLPPIGLPTLSFSNSRLSLCLPFCPTFHVEGKYSHTWSIWTCINIGSCPVYIHI